MGKLLRASLPLLLLLLVGRRHSAANDSQACRHISAALAFATANMTEAVKSSREAMLAGGLRITLPRELLQAGRQRQARGT